MPRNRTNTPNQVIVPTPGDLVKGKIVSAGLQLTVVARTAKMAKQTLSDYLAGRIRNANGQFGIMCAYCKLTGKVTSLREFWGELLSRDVA